MNPRSFQIALDQAQANLALTRQQGAEQSAAVKAARAQLAQRQAERVRIVDPDPKHPLRIGTTATVAIRVA